MTDIPQKLLIDHIEADPKTGEPRIAGTRYTVAFLSTFIGAPEWTVQRIVENYPLTPAQIHAAWSYYYDHREEIEAFLSKQPASQNYISDLPGYKEFMARPR